MGKNGFGKFIAGAAVGAGLGLLFSPKSGEDNRKDLKAKFDELIEQIKGVNAEDVKDYFEKRYIHRNENFANGRDVRNFFEKALIRQADRLSNKGNNLTDEELSELTLSDVEEIKLKD